MKSEARSEHYVMKWFDRSQGLLLPRAGERRSRSRRVHGNHLVAWR